MKNLAKMSVGPAFASLEKWGRRLPVFVLIDHVRAVQVGILGLVVLLGAAAAGRFLIFPAPAPEALELNQPSLHSDKIPHIEQLQQQRQTQAAAGLNLGTRTYFEPPEGNS